MSRIVLCVGPCMSAFFTLLLQQYIHVQIATPTQCKMLASRHARAGLVLHVKHRYYCVCCGVFQTFLMQPFFRQCAVCHSPITSFHSIVLLATYHLPGCWQSIVWCHNRTTPGPLRTEFLTLHAVHGEQPFLLCTEIRKGTKEGIKAGPNSDFNDVFSGLNYSTFRSEDGFSNLSVLSDVSCSLTQADHFAKQSDFDMARCERLRRHPALCSGSNCDSWISCSKAPRTLIRAWSGRSCEKASAHLETI